MQFFQFVHPGDELTFNSSEEKTQVKSDNVTVCDSGLNTVKPSDFWWSYLQISIEKRGFTVIVLQKFFTRDNEEGRLGN